MNGFGMNGFGPGFGPMAAHYFGFELFGIMLIVLAVWALVWKGLALWHAARNGETGWFIAVLLLNTVGILEIVYLFAFRKNRATVSVFPRREKPATPATAK